MFLCNPASLAVVLCPHPDDEIGCGGFLSYLIENGVEIRYFYFSNCAQSTVALGFSPEQLIEECRESCRVLGIPADKVQGFDFPVRHFPQHRQALLELLVTLRQKLKPSLVLVPASTDGHQDHATLAQEAARAFKDTTVLGYEFPWNQKHSRVDLLVRLQERHIAAKIRAWEAYKTQASRPYHGPAILTSLARVRGVQANCEFAEAYEVVKMVI